MKKSIKVYLLLALMVSAFACSTDPDEKPQDLEEEEIFFSDTTSLKSGTLNLLNYIPTWEELERFTDPAERLTLPSFEKRVLSWSGLPGEEGAFDTTKDWMPQVLEYSSALTGYFGSQAGVSTFNDVPPFSLADGSRIPIPYPLEILDAKLRATTVLYLYEKSLGLYNTFVHFYPPDQEIDKFTTQAQFYTWLENRFLPEKAAEAKAAELMKAEKFIPWHHEFELFIAEVGGIHDGGFLSNSSEAEILAFANDVKTKILNTVKSEYNGIVVAHLYNNYQRPGFDYWDQMSYSGFDEIHFALFPPYDAQTTGPYMDTQIEHYTKIVRNSGNIPWIASEISVFEWYVEDGKLLEHEKGMYETVFTKLEAAPIPPKGISPAGGYMKSTAAKEYVKNYFATH